MSDAQHSPSKDIPKEPAKDPVKDEPTKTTEKPVNNEQINLKVVTQDSTEVFFKIKKNTPLKKLMEAFCNKQGLNMSSVRFLSDGVRITPDKTASDLGLQDGDVIDAMMNQVGGF
ncbi:ubiquitin family protein [Entamoeba histolytica HM-1:IMSS-B]|uniref:Ubiquitin-like protein n=8 Tax=Entamoeba TaxID=5758 RepID=C4M1C8_ENTH1|nr:ubiquitin family protein [Entamoeba nuttalli P19]XP_655984.1 ubiquitin-like protein [Entamoeba histolytica HM-1:IMSS]EMD43683.1 ubiquitin family protein [Entamoeba histolytica KU27]EMH75509.1 ubiquitin family protein [Entamoeba histolytica HM-1:IMSS-B]EMS16666.1 ubiquitin family protein [Entamoeba histolytica HM-3:IMSS]ENY63484.1 ubiquitin family protein, putative [Entamoeba histolytica HM-1:IMSS-A]GAT95006.1 ubiquitin like protein [Entamoeba histolytica]|eukprot:XP_008860715.1 ubiquitin family protein [Entamoeba nuttalli P19]